jgi:hypothetical protein
MAGPHRHRGPHTIVLGDGWKQFVPLPPQGWEMLGTIHRVEAGTGALVRSPKGEYFCGKGITLEPLIHRKVEGALRAAGHPQHRRSIAP